MCGIYKITNKVNCKCYIGQALDINKRWADHKRDAFNSKIHQYHSPLYQAFRKYGLDNFVFEVIEECAPIELDEREIFYISQFEAFGPNGYNQTPGGRTAKRCDVDKNIALMIIDRLKSTEDSYQEIAEEFGLKAATIHSINNGKCCYCETESYPIREPLGELAKYHNNCLICGKQIEIRNTHCVKCSNTINNFKLRKAQRPNSLELAKLIIDNGFVQVGKIFGVSDNAIKKWLRFDGAPHKKDDLIAWYNEQMGIIPEPKPVPKSKDEIVRPVKQIDIQTGEILNIFNSQRDALRHLGIESKNNHIGEVCKGKRKSAYGYIWEYA